MNLTVRVIEWNGTGVPPIDLPVDIGNINIGGSTNVAVSATHTTAVANGSSVILTVSQPGYKTYTMTIDNVYDSDKTVYIMLVPDITDINDANYNRPHPMFYYFQDPCSFRIDYYNASSFPGEITWYINNQVLQTIATKGNTTFCKPGSYQLKVRGVTYETVTTGPDGFCPITQALWDRQWANTDEPTYVLPGQSLGQGESGNVIAGTVADLSTYLDIDTATNVTEVEYRPSFDLSLNSPVNQLDETCCYTRNESVTVTASVNITRPGSVATDYTLDWEVIGPDGLVVTTQTTTLAAGNITFTLSQLGVYTVNVVLTDLGCNIRYPQTIEVETCNFITFDYIDCNSYTISNRSSATDVTYTVASIDGTTIAENQSLPQGQSSQISFTTPSLYTVTITYTRDGVEVLETYVLNNYCVIEDCLSEYILDILCEDTRRCAPCPDTVELNQLLMLHYTYFMELNKEYGLNNFYSGLNQSQLERLGNIKQVMDRILEFCGRRNCQTFGTDVRPAGSETLDWVGKGSNKQSCSCTPKPSSSYYNTAKPGYCGTCNGTL